MTDRPYVTFAHKNDEMMFAEQETYHLPDTTRVEAYARQLAPDVWRVSRALRRERLDQFGTWEILVPNFGEDEAKAMDGGRLLGIPMRVVDGLTEPMWALALKLTELP